MLYEEKLYFWISLNDPREEIVSLSNSHVSMIEKGPGQQEHFKC